MLFIIAIFLALTGMVLATRVLGPGRMNAANIGWMSERWVAEYHASQPASSL